MRTFFTSDHHFGHYNIIKYCNRPYSSVEEMDEDMVKKWNETVKPGDAVWYLGDFTLSKDLVIPFAKRLNGSKKLIWGNHDALFPKNSQNLKKFTPLYQEAGFEIIGGWSSFCLEGNKYPATLCHFPYNNQDPRFVPHRPKYCGGAYLNGHVHNNWKQKENMINVGVDVWNFYPVSLEQIMELIK